MMRRLTSAKAFALINAALFYVALLSSPAAWAKETSNSDMVQVSIDNFAFTPDSLTVKAGTKVTFVNHDDIPHSIVSGDSLFRSKALDTDDSFIFTFADPGEYGYFCGLHPHMIGKIVVVP